MEGEAFPHLFPCEIKPTNEQIEGGEKCAPMIAGASRVHWEIKGEINKSRHGRVYMYNTGEQLLGSVRTQAESRILTFAQINKQIESRSSSSEKKRCQMALWEVVSQDEAGEAPLVSLREIIHAHTHLPPRTWQVITTEEEEEEEKGEC